MESFVPLLVLTLIALAALAVFWRKIDPSLRPWILAGLMLRVLGSQARVAVISNIYGRGDALTYFDFGRRFADGIWEGDFRFIQQQIDLSGRWTSTSFVSFSSAFAQAAVGDDLRALFFLYALLSFAGLLLCVAAWKNVFGAEAPRYARWLLLAPSLWFWPSSIGKEAFVIFGIGLTVFGFAGRQGRLKWVAVFAGLLVVACVRPHIAVLIAVGLGLSEVLAFRFKLRFGGWISSGLIAAAAVGVVMLARSELGFDGLEVGEIQQEYEFRSGQTQQGGSKIESVSGIATVLMAPVNVLLRPFPWDPGSNRWLTVFASGEVMFFWYFNRRAITRLPAVIRLAFRDRFVRFLLVTGGALILLYGTAYSNLGLLTRQRVVILPLIFALVLIARGLAESTVAKAPLVPRGSTPRLGAPA